MDNLLAAAAVLFLAIPVGYALALFVGRGPELMTGFFGPIRYDGWPQGVQEEDPSFDETFRLRPAAVVPEDDDGEETLVPETRPVSGAVRRRPNRETRAA